VLAVTSSAGSANNTVFIVPVDDSVARALVPSQYSLLPVNETLLPKFPQGKFPLLVVGGLDYNISDTLGLLQFAQGRINIPFVDRLSDGKTSFIYTPSLLMDNLVSGAIAAVEVGSPVYPAIIQPGQGSGKALNIAADGKTVTFNATGILNNALIKFSAASVASTSVPWPIDTFYTLANLPAFGANSSTCYLHVEYDPSSVLALAGDVSLGPPPLLESMSFSNVYGVSANKVFSETLGVDCATYAS